VKKMLCGSVITMSLLLVLAGCAKEQSAKAEGAEGTVSTLVTFVELGSVRCVPCRLMQPIMRDIESTYQGQVRVVFHDVWTEAGKPYVKQFGVRVIPTQVFLDANGVEYFRHEGFFPKEQLVAVLKSKGVK
jgi:thioredoxin 1